MQKFADLAAAVDCALEAAERTRQDYMVLKPDAQSYLVTSEKSPDAVIVVRPQRRVFASNAAYILIIRQPPLENGREGDTVYLGPYVWHTSKAVRDYLVSRVGPRARIELAVLGTVTEWEAVAVSRGFTAD